MGTQRGLSEGHPCRELAGAQPRPNEEAVEYGVGVEWAFPKMHLWAADGAGTTKRPPAV